MGGMRRAIGILILLIVPGIAAAQAPGRAPVAAYRLTPGLWRERQTAKREFDASGGRSGSAYELIQSIDTQYRLFVYAVSEEYEKKDSAAVEASCTSATGDPEASIFCALMRYRLDGRKDPERFLAALPATQETATALDDLRKAASQNPNAPVISAAPVYSVTEAIFQLMVAGNAKATARYFYLLHHSNGAWADHAADELEHYLTDHPAALIRNWPVLRHYWNLSAGITWDVDAGWWENIVSRYKRACSPAKPSCGEVLKLIKGAARAAGAPG